MNKEKKSSNECSICGRPTHKESKYCIFHAGAQEKTEKEFKKALKAYLEEIKIKKMNYDFEKFIFIGDINFNNIEFVKDPKFVNTKFLYGSINFKNTEFKEKASFLCVLFNGTVDFSKASFRKEVEFKGTKFEGGPTSFKEVLFSNDVSFEGNIFQNNIDFSNAAFHGNFNCSFDKFNGTELNFNCVDINKKFEMALNEKHYVNLNFESITTYFGFVDIKLIVINGNISFRNTLLEKISLCFEIYNDSYIDFEGARIKDTVLRRDHIEGYLIQENRKIYSKAKEIYITLKNNFHSIGRYDDESWAYIKERDMEKLSYSFNNSEENYTYQYVSDMKNIFDKFILRIKFFMKWFFSKKFLNWFKLTISSFIYGYGESPWKVIRFASIAIVLFALIFNKYGIITTSYKLNFLEEYLRKTESNGYILKYLGSMFGNFWNCLYFSVITFTTLGYGDFQPLEGWSRFFAGSEAFIGAFMMALFVYTFARRTGGR